MYSMFFKLTKKTNLFKKLPREIFVFGLVFKHLTAT